MKGIGREQLEDLSERLGIWESQPRTHSEGGGQEQGGADEKEAPQTPGEGPGCGPQARWEGPKLWNYLKVCI